MLLLLDSLHLKKSLKFMKKLLHINLKEKKKEMY